MRKAFHSGLREVGERNVWQCTVQDAGWFEIQEFLHSRLRRQTRFRSISGEIGAHVWKVCPSRHFSWWVTEPQRCAKLRFPPGVMSDKPDSDPESELICIKPARKVTMALCLIYIVLFGWVFCKAHTHTHTHVLHHTVNCSLVVSFVIKYCVYIKNFSECLQFYSHIEKCISKVLGHYELREQLSRLYISGSVLEGQ